MVTSSMPRPIPTRKRKKITPSALLCVAISSEKDRTSERHHKVRRRPSLSASGASRLAPINSPIKVAEAKAAWSAMPKMPACPVWKMPSASRPVLIYPVWKRS